MTMPTINTVGFDFDGTLADSFDTTAGIEQQLLRERDATVSDEVFAQHTGRRFQDFLTEVVQPMHGHVDIEELVIEYLRRFGVAYIRGAIIDDAALRMIERLRDEELKLFIGSNNDGRFVEPVLSRYDAEEMFDSIVCADHPEVNHPKPSPDIIQVAVDQVGTSVNNTIFVGDTTYDIRAAQSAGVAACIGMVNGHNLSHHQGGKFRIGEIVLGAGGIHLAQTLVRPASDFPQIGDMILSFRDHSFANQKLWV